VRSRARTRSAFAALLALPAALALLSASGCGGAARSAPESARPLVPTATTETSAPEPPRGSGSSLPALRGQLVVQIMRRTMLHARPGGRAIAQLAPTTSFRSPTVVPVLHEHDGWYGVISSALPNGTIGWIAPHAAVQRFVSSFRIDASLRHRQVVVRDAGRVVARFPVAVGGPATPTPTGRFAVTDKLLTRDAGSPYGCCIIALSARQVHTPQGWGGGDRVAIHTTDRPWTIGSAASLGCLRAPTWAMRRILRAVPLGTVVTIRA
jgi:hypothetical protein